MRNGLQLILLAIGSILMTDTLAQTKDPVILVALTELTRRGLDPGAYGARVTDAGTHFIVVFRDRDLPPGARGIVPRHPTLEVEISAKDRQVIKSYFAR